MLIIFKNIIFIRFHTLTIDLPSKANSPQMSSPKHAQMNSPLTQYHINNFSDRAAWFIQDKTEEEWPRGTHLLSIMHRFHWILMLCVKSTASNILVSGLKVWQKYWYLAAEHANKVGANFKHKLVSVVRMN